jgi:hypothetical protein
MNSKAKMDTVPQSDHAVPEALLIEQLQLQPHTIREEPFSGADYHREAFKTQFRAPIRLPMITNPQQ